MSEFYRVLTKILIFISLVMFSAFEPARAQTKTSAVTVEKVYWSDGDSGRLGNLKFRSANVDAPETGSLKQRGGAKCELEREKGYNAKAYIVALTKSGKVKVERDYGYDRYQRLVVDLSVDGVDVGGFAHISAGDVNGDGLDDLIIGAPNDDPTAPDAGAGFAVIFFDAEAVEVMHDVLFSLG